MSPPPTLIGTYTLLELACVKQNRFDKAERSVSAKSQCIQGSAEAKSTSLDRHLGVIRRHADQDPGSAQIHRPGLQSDSGSGPREIRCGKRSGRKVETSFADALRSIGAIAEAEQNYTLALTHLKSQAKDGDAVLLRVMNSLAGIFVKDGRTDAAEQFIKTRSTWSRIGRPLHRMCKSKSTLAELSTAISCKSLNRVDEAKKTSVFGVSRAHSLTTHQPGATSWFD